MPANSSSTVSNGFGMRIYEFLQPPVDYELFHVFIRKMAHFSEYALLGILGFFCCEKEHRLKLLAVCVLAACADETIQLFVEGRSGQISDVVLDSCGVFFGEGLYLFVNRLLR